MADVKITPRISCDNCGHAVDKETSKVGTEKNFKKPSAWGSMKIEGSRSADSYGGKERLDFTDLCPECVTAAIDAAAAALRARRGEDEAHG